MLIPTRALHLFLAPRTEFVVPYDRPMGVPRRFVTEGVLLHARMTEWATPS